MQIILQKHERDAMGLAEFIRLATWNPAEFSRLGREVTPRPSGAAAKEGADAVARAERILHLIDSGSGPSAARLERRRGHAS